MFYNNALNIFIKRKSIINITPVKFTHLNSTNNIKKNNAQTTRNNIQKTYVTTQNKVSSDVFKAYNPQISFTRRKVLNDEGQVNP